jgi:DNA ligase 1
MQIELQFSKVASFFQQIEETDSRLKMTEILSCLFKEAEALEIDKICYLCLGELAPKFAGLNLQLADKMIIRILSSVFGVSQEEVVAVFKQKGDLGIVFQQLSENKVEKRVDQKLSVTQVYEILVGIAGQGGGGSQERKIQGMTALLKSVDPLSGKYLVRIPLSKLRLGFSEMTILDGLSWMETGDKSRRKDLEEAFNIRADIGQIAQIFKTEGLEGLKKIKPQTGIPIRPALSTPLLEPGEILTKMSGRSALEPKFDGFRVQVHIDKQKKTQSQARG